MAMVVGLFLAQEKGTPMKPVAEAHAISGRGFEGDRHALKPPGSKRQLLILDERSLEDLQVAPGALKENVIVSGLPLEDLPPGQRLRLGDVLVELSEQCVPCQKLDLIRPGLLKESWGKRGQLAKVLEGGWVEVGDAVELGEINPAAPRKPQPKLPG